MILVKFYADWCTSCKELDKIMSVPLPVLHDSEISKIEETLVKLTQEMVERGRQPANKVNS